jgi:LPS O-antigen subunit length determinant protein (WzzB/FepE family)
MLFCFLAVLLVSAVACSKTEEPKIEVAAIIAKLSEEQFDDIGTNGLENLTIDDFRKLTFNFKMEHSPEKSFKVNFPDDTSWKQAINSIDELDRYWFGEFSKHADDMENAVSYNGEFIFYSKGLSEDEMRKAFDSIIINVSMTTEEGNSYEKEYIISDLIEFGNK